MNPFHQRRKQMQAVAAMAIVLMACCTVCVVEESEETEAIEPITTAIILFMLTYSIAVTAAYALDHYTGDSPDAVIVRQYEAQAVAESIANNVRTYKNTISNYDQIWRLTNEHWIRQAELAASELWSSGKAFDAYDVLQTSGVYVNSAYMADNAASQINELYTLVSDSLTEWNGTDTYRDKMELTVSWGSDSMSTRSDFSLMLGVAVPEVSEGADQVYLTDESTVWSSADVTISSVSGSTVTLSKGMNDLSSVPEFQSDVYILNPDAAYCGDMLPVIGRSAAMYSGAVIGCNGVEKLIHYDDGVICDGSRGSSLTITVSPDGGESKTADILPMLESYSGFLDSVYWTLNNAATAAATVWSIYDKAGSPSAYLSTLMVPNSYDGVEINAAQQEIITTLAMQQLADYWNESSGKILDASEYRLSDSMSLFVRGDIIDSSGNTLYEDVIYTPFFYQDTSLKTGQNQVSRQAFAAIWATDAGSISSWSGLTSTSECELVVLESGYGLEIYEMRNQGKAVTSIDLTVNQIDIIDPEKYEHTQFEKHPGNDLDKVIMLVLVILGILAIVSGWRSGSYIVMALGAVAILTGLFFSGTIAGALEEWFGWRFELG